MRFFAILAVLLGSLLCGPPRAQAQSTASLSGYVRDATNGETLLGANVILQGDTTAADRSWRGTATNNAGYYTLPDIPPGTYTVVASYLGFSRYTEEVTLEAGEERRLDIELQPTDVNVGEVVVTEEREEIDEQAIGTASLQTALIKELPTVLEPDLFRSLQLLPGIKAASDFSSGLYIRGGSPDQTLILLDRTTVYNPTHFFGLFSTFNPDAIKDVQLYKGGYPAEYGGRLGSVLSVYNKDGNREETKGGLSVGLLASRAYVEGPYGTGDDGDERGSYMLAIRRSTLEPVLAVLQSTDTEGIPDSFHFYDVNAKVNADIGANNRVSISAYGGQDVLDIEFLDDGRFDIEYGNRTLSADWTHLLTDRIFTNLTLTRSGYQSTPVATVAGTRFTQTNEVTDWSLKADIEAQPNERHTLKAGVWAGTLDFRLRETFDGNENFDQRLESEYASAYVQDTFSPTPDWEFTAGLRASHFASGNFWRLEPRLSVDYAVAPNVRLQGAYGRYHQYLTLETSQLFTGFDTWLTADDGVPPAYGDQFVAGVKTQPFPGWELNVEGYARTMRDLFERDPFLPDIAGVPYAETFRFGRGRAYGGELLLRRNTGRLSGFLGYTLGRTERRFPQINVAGGEPQFYVPKYDRTHDLNLVVNYRLTTAWKLTGVFNYATGQAYTQPEFRYSLPNDPFQSSTVSRDVLISPFNGARLPAYHRLDVGATRQGQFFGIADYRFQVQLINAYAQRNIWFYLFEFEDDGTVTRNEVPQIPVPIPNLSFSLTF
jgi:hypothetical protein